MLSLLCLFRCVWLTLSHFFSFLLFFFSPPLFALFFPSPPQITSCWRSTTCLSAGVRMRRVPPIHPCCSNIVTSIWINPRALECWESTEQVRAKRMRQPCTVRAMAVTHLVSFCIVLFGRQIDADQADSWQVGGDAGHLPCESARTSRALHAAPYRPTRFDKECERLQRN